MPPAKKAATSDYVVLLIGYSRPDLLKRRLEEISIYGPKHLIVSLDHHSPEKQSELADITRAIQPNAKLWLSKHRLGLAVHITSAITRALLEHEYVIVVEDDVSVSEDFFNSIISYLPTMRSQGYASIGGFSPLSAVSPVGQNYFIRTKYFSSWGWATSRETWSEYQLDLRGYKIDEATFTGRNWKFLTRHQKRTWVGRFRKIQLEKPHTWDIQFQFYNFKADKDNLLPIWPLVQNEGFNDSRSAHTVGRKPNWMGSSKYEYKPIIRKIENKFLVLSFNYLMSYTIAGDRKSILLRFIALGVRSFRILLKKLAQWLVR